MLSAVLLSKVCQERVNLHGSKHAIRWQHLSSRNMTEDLVSSSVHGFSLWNLPSSSDIWNRGFASAIAKVATPPAESSQHVPTVSSSCETKVSRQLGIAKPQHSFFSTTTMNLLELLDTLTRTTRHHFSIQFKEMYGNVWNCCVNIPEKHLPAPDKICRCHPPEVYIELRATFSNL